MVVRSHTGQVMFNLFLRFGVTEMVSCKSLNTKALFDLLGPRIDTDIHNNAASLRVIDALISRLMKEKTYLYLASFYIFAVIKMAK